MRTLQIPSGTYLGIETSCDETAASVIVDGVVRSSVISSQMHLHADFGGVVPELASREHAKVIWDVIDSALEIAKYPGAVGIDAVAVTAGPGLSGSLMVGVAAAKAIALALGIDLIGVDHMEGHLFASSLDGAIVELPALVLLVSGGHTQMIFVEGPGLYRYVGGTLDDAAGEAFDKVARFLGLGFPGGPAIEEAAKSGDKEFVKFPRALANSGFDLSFSGLKTAVVNFTRSNPDTSASDIAASFQEAVVEVLSTKLSRAAKHYGANSLVIGGGVAANGSLRSAVTSLAERLDIAAVLPQKRNCTDNGAMIAGAGAWRLYHDGPSSRMLGIDPSLSLPLLK